MFQYICLLEARTLCRFKKNGYQPPEPEDITTQQDDRNVMYDDEEVEGGEDFDYKGRLEVQNALLKL